MESDRKPPLNYVEVTEQRRLNEAREKGIPWKKWGPYLSERQWGTVREDYSADGNAWDYFTHDQSRSRAYRWGALFEVAKEIARRLSSIFLRDTNGQRPVYGLTKKFQDDPHWRDYILFYEYFHGDNGAGLGASHQTGWTGLIARSLDLFARLTPEMVMETPKTAIAEMTREQVAGQKV
jgi:hypothetical protein